nr:copia protein [Tanacetum cinerariifolium]
MELVLEHTQQGTSNEVSGRLFGTVQFAIKPVENSIKVPVDPPRLQSPFNSRDELFAPCHVRLSPEIRIHTWIEPLDHEFLDSLDSSRKHPFVKTKKMIEMTLQKKQNQVFKVTGMQEEESIDNAFAKFNTIITSLKALDEGEKRSDEDNSSSDSEDESMLWLLGNLRNSSRYEKDLCGDLNHLIGECSKPSKNNDQRALIGGAWSDNEEDEVEKIKNETCLVAQVPDEICLEINLDPDEWIKDSECSKHMTVNRKLFSSYKAYNEGNVIFGSNLRVEESLNATFDETPPPPKTSPMEGDELVGEEAIEGSGIETIVYANSDHAGDYIDRKITSGDCLFMRCCLTSWFSKKQIALAISTTEAEYVRSEKACQQALWMKQSLVDYGVRLDDIPIMCDNIGAIDLSKNLVQHSRTKHIKIHHHFLRDNVQKGNISIEKVSSENNIADILTKPLKREPFNYLHLDLRMTEQID